MTGPIHGYLNNLNKIIILFPFLYYDIPVAEQIIGSYCGITISDFGLINKYTAVLNEPFGFPF